METVGTIMIKIAICESDLILASDMEELLLSYSHEKRTKFDIDIWNNIGSLLNNVIEKGCAYDLIYLEVGEEQIGNLSVVQNIRAAAREMKQTPLFIYLSDTVNCAQALIETEPFRLLVKPFDRESFCCYLDQAAERIQNNAGYFSYSSKRSIYRIPLTRILYFESCKRKILLHTVDGEEIFYNKLSEIQKELSGASIPFLRIHQSYLVNYNAIVRYSLTEIKLRNGEILPISTEHQKEVRRLYTYYLTWNPTWPSGL